MTTVHATMETFGYPHTVIKEYNTWAVLYRKKQATLGALVLVCKEDVAAFASISTEAFTELQVATRHIESALRCCFGYDKINYLMLMMIDPHVHFHVIPRYGQTKTFAGRSFVDPGWPGVPDLGYANETNAATDEAIIAQLKAEWS